jgi:hypothetical protein
VPAGGLSQDQGIRLPDDHAIAASGLLKDKGKPAT